MSFRELRSFAETMRLLGYPNLISMESFRNPNVELVADCVYWLIKRYEPSADVIYAIERETDRVYFFKQVCEVAQSKGRIKLNIKKLYKSDGHAVQEMLKLANVLKKAMRAMDEEEPDFASLQQMAAQKNVSDAKAVQQLCGDLTGDSSTLFFLVEEEINSRMERQRVLSRATEVGEFERRLRELLQNVTQQVEQLQQSIANLTADESNLEQKIEGKKTQLDRAQKRYKSLMAVRPAFVEEYDKHDAELQSQFVKYLELYRNLEYLEHQFATYTAKEDALLEQQETQLRVMRERLRREELKNLRSSDKKSEHARGVNHPLTEDGSDSDGDGAGSRVHVRNAAEEGSSDEESSEFSEPKGHPPRPQNSMGRSRDTSMAHVNGVKPPQNGHAFDRSVAKDNGSNDSILDMARPQMGGVGRMHGRMVGTSESESSSDDTETDSDDDDDDTDSSYETSSGDDDGSSSSDDSDETDI